MTTQNLFDDARFLINRAEDTADRKTVVELLDHAIIILNAQIDSLAQDARLEMIGRLMEEERLGKKRSE